MTMVPAHAQAWMCVMEPQEPPPFSTPVLTGLRMRAVEIGAIPCLFIKAKIDKIS